jgi:hypothetical protein
MSGFSRNPRVRLKPDTPGTDVRVTPDATPASG